jgi:hypothetical protein
MRTKAQNIASFEEGVVKVNFVIFIIAERYPAKLQKHSNHRRQKDYLSGQFLVKWTLSQNMLMVRAERLHCGHMAHSSNKLSQVQSAAIGGTITPEAA